MVSLHIRGISRQVKIATFHGEDLFIAGAENVPWNVVVDYAIADEDLYVVRRVRNAPRLIWMKAVNVWDFVPESLSVRRTKAL